MRKDYTSARVQELPFVRRAHGKRTQSFWSPPQAATYGDACSAGNQFGAHFARFLQDNPGVVGSNLLGCIAADIDFAKADEKGYWVGFFAYPEGLILLGANQVDVFARADRIQARYDRAIAASANEPEESDE
ncbi:hypothetical protein ACOTH5_31725 [Achromobacter xylosoxidans]|uniref:hypothetical protein n=1 Tax=Alcaligenes xylosoxydans xylosoxydans TaxID=85698 RepID=UPI00047A5BC1|nr:hypothetical protein [Achromobacter xylosoxidans]QQE59192.1 hypothetical protein I6H41_09405 [Achromobacter xylosoxidans]QQV12936.1 hypothetical protein I6I48_24525 [Achromobacter xylosoxidans]